MIAYLILMAAIGLAAAIYLLPRWELTVKIVMVLLVYEGALRKWVLPSLQAEVYIAKDILVVMALLGFIWKNKRTEINIPGLIPVKLLIYISTVFFGFLIFNTNSPNIFLSILGFKNYVLYFVIFFLAYNMYDNRPRLYRDLVRYCYLVTPAVLVSYLQFVLPPTHWLNAYVEQQEGVESITSQFGDLGLARTAGTFSYLSGNTTFLMAMFLLSLSLLLGDRFRLKTNVFMYGFLVATIGATFTTGSRFGTAAMILGGVFIVGLAVFRGRISIDVFIRFLVGSFFVFAAIAIVAREQIEALLYRVSSAGDSASRFTAPITELEIALQSTHAMGTGLASTHGGMVLIAVGRDADYSWLDGIAVELETAKIMLEAGPVGFILSYGLRLLVVGFAIRFALKMKNPFDSALLSALVVWFTIHLYLFIVNNPPAALYYYFGLGLMFALARIEILEDVKYFRNKISENPMIRRVARPV